LCKKKAKKLGCSSFENEKAFLIKARNMSSPFIAQYYCNNENEKPFGDDSIYMDYYPNTAKGLQIGLKHKIRILLQIIKGTNFLIQEYFSSTSMEFFIEI
jgi:hypothetical protein